MNYTIYDTTKQSPSLVERDMIWSVLLFGDHVQITSNFSPIFLMCGQFRFLPLKAQFHIQSLFKEQIDKEIGWRVFEAEIKMISKLRHKKNRTQLDQINLKDKELWLREIQSRTIEYLTSNLAQFNYDQILPLTLHYVDMREPEIKIVWHTDVLDPDSESDSQEHLVNIISNALSQKDNMFVFDERIRSFITNHSINEYTGKEFQQSEKPDVFSEKVFKIPLCYSLKADEIKIARNEMKQVFRGFHECIHRISAGEESFKTGIENMRMLLPEIQNKIESSNFVQNARNRQTELPLVDMHLAFASNRGILTILNRLDMLNEEQLLQASDILLKESNLDSLRPFMFITHAKNN